MSSFNREKIKEILMPIVMQAYETKDSNLDIRKNTLDIFSASIDSAIRGISLQEWESQERQRQIQKNTTKSNRGITSKSIRNFRRGK